MHIELSHLKHDPAKSIGSLQYGALVTIDGQMIGTAFNAGDGKETTITPGFALKIDFAELEARVAASFRPLDMSAYGLPDVPRTLHLVLDEEAERILNE